jgi:hypothetical protein
MGQVKRPLETGPRQPKERRVYRLWATFDSIPNETGPVVKLGYKTEDNDNDIHLAIGDSTGATMVVEFPHHSCTAGAQHRWDMQAARETLVKACSNKTPPHDPPKSFVELHGSARITDVLFFDFAHHQHGMAPNFAELHPVLRATKACCERT